MDGVVNTSITIPFTFEDDLYALVTGKVDGDFTKVAYLSSAPATTAAPSVAAISGQSGDYGVTFTPTATGLWRVNVSCAIAGDRTYRFGWNVKVVTAAQADPAAALASGAVTLVSPVVHGGFAQILRGDDYLAANGRALSWTIEDSTVPVGATVALTLFDGETEVLSRTMAVTDAGPPDAILSIDLTQDDTAALPKGTLRSAIVMTRSGGEVETLMQGFFTVGTTPP